MPVHTKLEVCSQDHKIVRSFQTKSFTATTEIEDVEAFILKKNNNFKLPFDIQILDQHHGFVTFDKDYLEEYNPFHTETIQATTAQSTSSSESTVTLRIFLSDDDLYPAMDLQYMMVLKDLEGVPEAVTRQNEQINNSLSTVEAPKYSITLSGDPKMAFVKGYNVHNKQRDQYICDQVNVNTGETTGTLTMIQGQKTERDKYKRILPQFRIWNDDIKNRINQVWTLLVYIVLDVYESGKHSLVYHPQRCFVKKDDPKQQLNPYEIPITTDDWMMNMGQELKLTAVVVEGAKKHHSSPLNLICDFENSNKSELFDLQGNYSKSRLALVLRNGDDVQWTNLVLSDEMIFEKKHARPRVINILNPPANLPSTPLKRRRSNKCQNTSSNRSKRTKTSRNNDSMTVSPTNNNSCDIRLNQNLPSYIGSQCIHTEPQATTNTLVAALKFTPDSTQTRNFSGDSIHIINTLGDDWDFSAGPDMDEIVLINNDLSLNDTVSFDSDLLNS